MTEEQNPFRERLGLLVPLNNLQATQQEQLLASAEILTFRKKDAVFQQGDRDSFAFYLLAGELEMWSGDQLIKKVVGGDAASFHPLAQLQPRQMSARALGNAQVLRLDRNLLDRLLSVGQEEPAPSLDNNIEVLEYETIGTLDWLTSMLRSELFARIPPANIQRLIDILETVPVKAGDEVIKQGDVGDYYYVIQGGRCEVCRGTRLGKEVRLAELGPGETFGEEALVSNAKRNATVRMLTDGTLGRMTQEHFIELIREPVLKRVSLPEAVDLVSAGARWLDVRFPEEHLANGIPGSLNLPLSFLRSRMKDLPIPARYIAYCDSGGRSSAAAFLLAQAGYDVCFVAHGAIDELGKPALSQQATPAPAPIATVEVPATANLAPTPAEVLVDAEVRAQALAAEVAKARLQIEQAQRLMAEATAAKAEVEKIVEQRMQSERTRVEHDANLVRVRLAEAQKLKQVLEAQHAAASAEAARQRAAQEVRAQELQQAIERTLAEKEQRLEEVYRKQALQLEQLHTEHAKARKTLDDTWQQIELESSMSKERLAAAQRLEEELTARENARAASLAAQEQALRESLKSELAQERQRFEAEFATFATEISQARQAQADAEAAKVGAAEEARRIILEYQEAQQRQFAALQDSLEAERAALAAEADRLRLEMAQAQASRETADSARRAIEQELQTLRQRQLTSAQTEAQLRSEIGTLETRAVSAAQDLAAAIATATATADRQRENAARLERTYTSDNDIGQKVRQELDDWVAAEERFQNSTAQREELSRRMAVANRIKARAKAAKEASEQREFSLLDEIAGRLGVEL
jgi:CRP-like cAMP-binding protein